MKNKNTDHFSFNYTGVLTDFREVQFEQDWIEHNTAVLVIHGIGHQKPLETLDQFTRTLVASFKSRTGIQLKIRHGLDHITDEKFGWINNYARLVCPGKETYLDIYEYYWAHHTEDIARIADVQNWFRDTIKGARKFYRRNARFGSKSRDRSLFFDKKGRFNYVRYRFFLFVTALVIPGITMASDVLFRWLGNIRILGLGTFFSFLLEQLTRSKFGMVTNVIADITIYNTSDQKSKFYRIRQNILNGAVTALQDLLEPAEGSQLNYRHVFLAGHSLGSQIAFDCINRVNMMVNLNKWPGYDQHGFVIGREDKLHISNVLRGLITFGSPLDKIAFFLREHVGDDEYIRLQFLNHYHSFKQREWVDQLTVRPLIEIENPLAGHFDNIDWRNYYDKKDYVSGGLDYYHPLVNIDCQFKAHLLAFTHGHYWTDQSMFADILRHMILKK